MSEKQTPARTFICIDFPDEVIKEAARIQEIISKKQFIGKMTELENLHLTLKFLGEITQEKIEKTKKQLSKIKFPELSLSLSRAGIFSYKGNPKIIWIKINGNVFYLQKQIDNSLSKLFAKEQRFMSHLTIVRIKHAKNKKQFTNYISQIKPKKIKFNVNSFKLKSSELSSRGPFYKTLQEYKLH